MSNQLNECISILSSQNSVKSSEAEWKTVAQTLYDSIKAEERILGIPPSKEVLPQLFINNMNAEQIWQQIEFQNNLVMSMAFDINNEQNLCFKIAELCSQVTEDVDDSDDDDDDEEDEGVEMSESGAEEDEDSVLGDTSDNLEDKNSDISLEDEIFKKDNDISNEDLSDSDLDKDTFGDLAINSDEEEEEEDDDGEDNVGDNKNDTDNEYSESEGKLKSEIHQKSKFPTRTFSQSVVDSEFFNLRQSEWIADNDIIGENVGDEIDLMEDIESEEEEERKGLMYKDFFDPPSQSSEDNIQEDNDKVKSKFASKLDEETSLKRELEEETFLSDKPWVLKGEVQKTDRPENSTLEHHLDFNVGVRLKPLITEETTKNIETLILSRIRAQSWDDVERKIKPVVNPAQYKQKLILDQEKSTKSLATIYEEEFLRKQQEAEGKPQTLNSILSESDEKFEELPAHKEIKKELEDLFMKLDALSNYHFTPKYKPPEVKVVSNLPAIGMEESTPAAVSDATLLAPQEIVAPIRGELKGETEKEKTDRKRERRSKKKHQKLRAKREEEKLKQQLKKKDRDGMLQTNASVKLVEKAFKKGQIKLLDNKQKGGKSSVKFFSEFQNHLQDRTKKRKADDSLNLGTSKKSKGNKPLTMSKLLL